MAEKLRIDRDENGELLGIEGPLVLHLTNQPPAAQDDPDDFEYSVEYIAASVLYGPASDISTAHGWKYSYASSTGIRGIPTETSIEVTDDGTAAKVVSTNGTIFNIRRLIEDDGRRWSTTNAPTPVAALDRIVSRGFGHTMATSPTSPAEELFATFADGSDDVVYLIYSSSAGTFARSSGGWFKFPASDTSLDGLEAVTVTGEFVDAYDKVKDVADRKLVMKYAEEEA